MAWELWRQDDNGNRFLVGRYGTASDAARRMAELTRMLHKQIYWITETPEDRDGEARSS